MKPNTQLNHIIGLAAEHLATINIDSFQNRVTVYIGGDKRIAKTDNRKEMAAVADWLALKPVVGWGTPPNVTEVLESLVGCEILEATKASATAVEADKQHVDKPRMNRGRNDNEVLLDISAPGQQAWVIQSR